MYGLSRRRQSIFSAPSTTSPRDKAGGANPASQCGAPSEVTGRCSQAEGRICTQGKVVRSSLSRAVTPDLLEIRM